MDRNGDQWTGDEVDAEARGEGATFGGGSNRDGGSGTEGGTARQRSIDTAAEQSVRPNDDGEAPTTTAGGGAAGGSD